MPQTCLRQMRSAEQSRGGGWETHSYNQRQWRGIRHSRDGTNRGVRENRYT